MAFWIAFGTLCFINICVLVYSTIAIARVRENTLAMREFDWKTQTELVMDVQTLKSMIQKVNGRISGFQNTKYDLAEEIQKGLQKGDPKVFLDG